MYIKSECENFRLEFVFVSLDKLYYTFYCELYFVFVLDKYI